MSQTQAQIESAILAYLKEKKPERAREIQAGTRVLSGGLLDSFEIHAFLVFLEETFRVQLSVDDLSSERFDEVRAIAGIGEQISRAFSENGSPTMGQSDGSGEAGIDLMPGSQFLRDLNRRPLAAHTAHTIIAGRISPVTEGQLAALSRKIKESARAASAPRWLRDWLASADEETTAFLKEAVRGLGDGCVTIDSARLAGVDDFVILEANHVSLIVNLAESSESTPPAIPIILDRLGDAAEPVQPQAED